MTQQGGKVPSDLSGVKIRLSSGAGYVKTRGISEKQLGGKRGQEYSGREESRVQGIHTNTVQGMKMPINQLRKKEKPRNLPLGTRSMTSLEEKTFMGGSRGRGLKQ